MKDRIKIDKKNQIEKEKKLRDIIIEYLFYRTHILISRSL